MAFAFTALLLSAVQPVQAPSAVEPLEPPACFGFWGMILFDSGSTRLSSASRAMLDNFLAGQRARPIPSGASLRGYTDRVGSRRANLDLARRRTMAVRDYLVAGGMSAAGISLEAIPEERGLVEIPDNVPEQENRNVQIAEQVAPEVSARWDAWLRIHGPYRGPVC